MSSKPCHVNPKSGRCNAGKPDDKERCERNPKTDRCRLRQKSKSRSRTHKTKKHKRSSSKDKRTKKHKRSPSKDRKHRRSSSKDKRTKKQRRSSSKHKGTKKHKRSLSKKHKRSKSKDKKQKTSKARSRSSSKPKTTTKPKTTKPRIAQRHALVFGGAGLPTIPICLTLAGRTSFRLGGERISRDDLKELFHRHGVDRKNMHLSLPKGKGCMVVVPDAVKERDLPERFWKELYKSNPEAVLIRVSDYFHHLSKFKAHSSRSRYL